MRVHRKVWLWWGKYWAVQLMKVFDEFSLGIRINFRQPVVDLYIGPLTIAVGWMPSMTHPLFAGCQSCRGFIITDRPVL